MYFSSDSVEKYQQSRELYSTNSVEQYIWSQTQKQEFNYNKRNQLILGKIVLQVF